MELGRQVSVIYIYHTSTIHLSYIPKHYGVDLRHLDGTVRLICCTFRPTTFSSVQYSSTVVSTVQFYHTKRAVQHGITFSSLSQMNVILYYTTALEVVQSSMTSRPCECGQVLQPRACSCSCTCARVECGTWDVGARHVDWSSRLLWTSFMPRTECTK